LAERYDLVVHCHLRWHGVFQRPHQILSRLAKSPGRRVAFVEEPIFLDPDGTNGGPTGPARLETQQPLPEITVLQPYVPPQAEFLPAVSTENQRLVRGMVEEYLAQERYRDVVRWHYAPMAIYQAGACSERAVVYDCMDELSAFKGAPPELIERERELMRQADVMFTGGRSMHEKKCALHPNIHRFDSGVDVDHFQKATRPETRVPADAAALPHPILGYYGVIDERMDLDAIRHVAEREPGWQILMIGPVTKIDESALPRLPNIHYTGQKGYDELPGYLKAFDVCLIPFADNDATRYLSPTKTLEYFAGMKPVVSSPVADVVEHYSDLVRIARAPEEWVTQVREALSDTNNARLRAGLDRACSHTWDSIVEQMAEQVERALRARS
jgi:glycosyltransferase involved in cell wall biosynthesis